MYCDVNLEVRGQAYEVGSFCLKSYMVYKTELTQALTLVQKILLQTSHLAGPHC